MVLFKLFFGGTVFFMVAKPTVTWVGGVEPDAAVRGAMGRPLHSGVLGSKNQGVY